MSFFYIIMNEIRRKSDSICVKRILLQKNKHRVLKKMILRVLKKMILGVAF